MNKSLFRFTCSAALVGLAVGLAHAQAQPATNCAPRLPGLIGWWPGEDDATDVVGSNQGTMHNGATFTDGIVARAFSFDGLDDVCRIPYSPSLEASAISVETWIKGTAPGSYQYVVSKYLSGDNSSYALYTGGDGTLYFYVTVGANNVALSPSGGSALWDSNWHHIAGTYDGAFVRLYVDGAQVGNGTAASGSIQYSSNPENELFIGNYHFSAPYALRAEIDELAIYNRALASNEIAGLYAARSVGKCYTNDPAPVFLGHPSSQTALEQRTATLTGFAMGTPRPDYQWLFNDRWGAANQSLDACDGGLYQR